MKSILFSLLLGCAYYFYLNKAEYFSQEIKNPILSFIQGKVFIYRDNQIFDASKLKKIFIRDIIITEDNSWGYIKYGNNSTIKILPNSKIQIHNLFYPENPNKEDFLELLVGSIFVRYNKHPDQNTKTLVVKIQSAALGVRGTHFFVDLNDSIKVAVKTGEVTVKNHDGLVYDLLKNTSMSIVGGIAQKPNSINSWASELDWSGKNDPIPEDKIIHVKSKLTNFYEEVYKVKEKMEEYYKNVNTKTLELEKLE